MLPYTSACSPKLYLLQTDPWDLLLYTESPLQSKEQMGARWVRSVHHHRLLWREQEGAGAAAQRGLHPLDAVQGPLQPCEVALAREQQAISPGLSLSSLVV